MRKTIPCRARKVGFDVAQLQLARAQSLERWSLSGLIFTTIFSLENPRNAKRRKRVILRLHKLFIYRFRSVDFLNPRIAEISNRAVFFFSNHIL